MKHNKREDLVLPEYGRNIQQMVQHAITLENREERNKCAITIISIMANLYPNIKDTDGFKHKLWDQLAMMSNFELDVDYPFEIRKPEDCDISKEKIEFSATKNDYIRYRHYGINMQNFIRIVAEHPELPNREDLIILLANQMKKLYLEWNKDSVDDRLIFDDIYYLSNHRIQMDYTRYRLDDVPRFNNNNNRRKNNKKKG